MLAIQKSEAQQLRGEMLDALTDTLDVQVQLLVIIKIHSRPREYAFLKHVGR